MSKRERINKKGWDRTTEAVTKEDRTAKKVGVSKGDRRGEQRRDRTAKRVGGSKRDRRGERGQARTAKRVGGSKGDRRGDTMRGQNSSKEGGSEQGGYFSISLSLFYSRFPSAFFLFLSPRTVTVVLSGPV